ncbi:aldo/keto reductase [Chungangia koreensis]|uniref:Aldo/keto reductase n=1 Tax=Chungangia koreensis TaxID=752657 RepID=A0ABV8X6H5_9LACT
MKYRELGHSGCAISEISLGCMSLPSSAKEVQNIIDAALDFGINYFDTADLYDRGQNEELVGKALKHVRDQVIIATKVGNRWFEGKEGWQWDASKEYIETAVKDSLSRLGTDYIDFYQLHGGTMEDELEEVVDVFEKLKKEGLIRHYGISSIRPNVIRRFLKNGNPSSVMMQYSLLDRRPEEWLTMIQENGASVVARGSLAKGLLTAEWTRRLDGDKYLSYSNAELKTTLENLNGLSAPIHSIALHYVLNQSAIASCVTGASSTEQLAETMNAYNQMVPEDILLRAADLSKTETYQQHRE